MAKNYELLLALSEDTKEEAQKDLVEQVRSAIEKAKGEITSSDPWGKRALAFPLKGSKSGFYWLVNFKGEGNLPKVITDILRIEDSVLRFIVAQVQKAPVKSTKKKPETVKVRKLDELVVR